MTKRATGFIPKDACSRIRYSLATDTGLARKYGVSVAVIRKIRAGAVPLHPVRIAARRRAAKQQIVVVYSGGGGTGGRNGYGFGRVVPSTVPATAVRQPQENRFR